MSYILLDESGDLSFSFKKGCSKYFIVTIIVTESKRRLEKIARTVHKHLTKKHKIGVLHAYKEEDITRKRLLKLLSQADCGIFVIILDKKGIYSRLKNEKVAFHNFITDTLLNRIFSKRPSILSHPIILIASRRETSKFLNKNFKEYIVNRIMIDHNSSIDIQISTPFEEKSLQVVDFASWAIFRKYEFGDPSYYNIIKSRIIEESPLYP